LVELRRQAARPPEVADTSRTFSRPIEFRRRAFVAHGCVPEYACGVRYPFDNRLVGGRHPGILIGGFDAVSCVAQEVVKPSRDIPIGILGSLFVCTILYVLVSLVLTGVVPYKELNVPAPVSLAVERSGPSVAWLQPWIEIGALGGLSSVVLVLLLAQPRIFHRMAVDGLFPKAFTQIHPKFRTPTTTMLLTGGCAAILAGLLPIDVLSSMVSIGTLLAFTIVCISVVILRKTKPELERAFRTPWVPFIPAAGAIICFGQMLFLPLATWIRLIVWLAIGMAIYFGYGYRHSHLNRRR
jgi:APA family basic amino acid/polyamine antiporter